jgi:N-acetylmuramoyl-L-alanine amidase
VIRLAALLLALALPAAASGLRPGAAIEVSWRGALTLTLPLERPTPWRAHVAADPWRLVVEARGVDWSALDASPDGDVATEAQVAQVAGEWSRLTLALAGPMRIERAWMETGGAPVLTVEARPGAGAEGPLGPPPWATEALEPLAVAPVRQDDRLTVALDPGHGGVDPGALHGDLVEAELTLTFARELRPVLERAGHRVVLTREDDRYVGLRARASIARAAGADLMISLHADAVEGGGASGATVYTLSEGASDALSAELAARHGRGDLIAGLEVDAPGDEVARVLVDLARAETEPRADALADAVVAGLGAAGIRLHKRPRLEAAFTVLKAPDMPSVLLELGFISSQADRRNLRSADWRRRMAEAVAASVAAWAADDAGRRALMRR